eukprot:6194144-Pleurochrysis_carterae.AAC.1
MTLPVKLIGSIILRIPAGDVNDGHGDYSNVETTLALRDALYVPGLCATLRSTKAVFKLPCIRTYLNDEVRLVLPNDNHARIRKTAANHTASRSLLIPSCTR